MGAFSLAFLGAVPVTTYLTKPGGAFESVLQAYLRVLLPGAATVSSDRLIPAMTAVYAFFTFAATGAFSAAGVAAAHEEGMDMNSELGLATTHDRLVDNLFRSAIASEQPERPAFETQICPL